MKLITIIWAGLFWSNSLLNGQRDAAPIILTIESGVPGLQISTTCCDFAAPCVLTLDPIIIDQIDSIPSRPLPPALPLIDPITPEAHWLKELSPSSTQIRAPHSDSNTGLLNLNSGDNGSGGWIKNCHDIATGSSGVGQDTILENASMVARVLSLPPLIQLGSMWNGLDLTEITTRCSSPFVQTDTRFDRQVWAELTVTGADHYQLEVHSNVGGEVFAFGMAQSQDHSNDVFLGKCLLVAGSKGLIRLEAPAQCQPIRLMVATASEEAPQVQVLAYPTPLTARPPKSPPQPPAGRSRGVAR